MPKVSIVIPVYNVEKYLRECLDSVVAQTLTDWECICVDDGSTDSSPTILDEYAAKDMRFRIIRRDHTNAGACRNVGLDLAKGEFLSFLDSDDVFAPKMLETLFFVAQRSKADIVSCGFSEFYDGATIPLWRSRRHSRTLRIDNPADTVNLFDRWVGWAWDKLFRASFVNRTALRFQEIPSSNDACFTYASLSLATSVVCVMDQLVAHRKRLGSIESSRTDKNVGITDAIRAYRTEMLVREVFSAHPHLEADFKHWALQILFWHLDTIGTLSGYEKIYAEIPHLASEIDLDGICQVAVAEPGAFVERLRVILEGGKPIESIRHHEQMLSVCVKELQSLAQCASSLDYRIGHMILALPRKIKRLFGGGCLCNDRCLLQPVSETAQGQ